MSVSKNIVDRSDVSTYPITLHYTSSIGDWEFPNYGITVKHGVLGGITSTGSVDSKTILYKTIQQLYYNEYLTGSIIGSASYWNDTLQSTAASGSGDNDYRYFPYETGSRITVLSMNRGVFGDYIGRNKVRIESANFVFTDDGNGNVYDSGSATHIGNILYSQGVIVITNPDYQWALIPMNCPFTVTVTEAPINCVFTVTATEVSVIPSPSPTPSITPTVSVSITPTVTPSVTPSISISQTPSVTPSISVSQTPSITLSITTTPSVSVSQTPGTSPSSTPTVTPSISVSQTPSVTPSISISQTPSVTPSISVSQTPSVTPSITVSQTPSVTPSISISQTPSITPSISVSQTPSVTPSITVSETPSVTPSNTPSITPSVTPSPSTINYTYYYADRYDCSTCSAGTNEVVAMDSAFTPNFTDFYPMIGGLTPYSTVWKITATGAPMTLAVPILDGPVGGPTCTDVCNII